MANITADATKAPLPNISSQAAGDAITLPTGRYVRTAAGGYTLDPAGTPQNIAPTLQNPGGGTGAYAGAGGQPTGTPAPVAPEVPKTDEQIQTEARALALKNAQDQINATNSAYDSQLKADLAAQAPANENNLGRTNALSAMMGLSGSSSADTRTGSAIADNNKSNSLISDKNTAARMQALASIYGRVDTNATELAKNALEKNETLKKTNADRLAKSGEALLTNAALLAAQAGKTFDDFKTSSPDVLQNTMDSTKKSEYELRQIWNNSLPEQYKPTVVKHYADDGKGGTIMTITDVDPVTKKTNTYTVPIAGVSAATFNGPTKPIDGPNGEIFMQTGTDDKGMPIYKDVSPNAVTNAEKVKAELAYQRSQTAKNYADVANGGKTTSQITAENYDAAKQEAVKVFQAFQEKNKGIAGYDNKIDPAIFGGIREKMPADKKDDFDKWARDAGYLSEDTMKQFGIVPAKAATDQAQALIDAINNLPSTPVKK